MLYSSLYSDWPIQRVQDYELWTLSYLNLRIFTLDTVINEIVQKSSTRQWSYSKTAAVTAKSGSGNNWSFGFSVLGKRHENEILKQIRKLAEDTDSISDGFLVILAMAGGTGSGVGSRTRGHGTESRNVGYHHKGSDYVFVTPV